MFNTKISYIVEDKWERCYNRIRWYAIIYIMYIIVLSVHITFLANSDIMVYVILGFQSIYFLTSEVPDICTDYVSYFKDITNYLDIISAAGVIYYCIQFMINKDSIVYFPLYIGVLFGYWRCFNFIQVFGPKIRTNVIMY